MSALDYDRILKRRNEYLSDDRKIMIDLNRKRDFNRAYEAAQFLFPKAEIKTEMDLLRIGTLTLCIKPSDIDINGQEMISSFAEIVEKADRLKISYIKPDGLCMTLVYRCVNTRENK